MTNLCQSDIKVSVVINTYNRAKLLPRAIESALSQTHANLEIIVVDGNSQDNTGDVVKGICDSRIRYVRSESTRSVDCVNLGFRLSTGKYIALLDDDDEWLPSKTEEQLAFFEQLDESYGWIGCGEVYIDDATDREQRITIPSLRGMIHKDLLRGAGRGVSGGTTLMFRKAAIEAVGGFIDISYSTDFLFYLKLSRTYKFDFISKVLCRTHENHIYQKQRGSYLPNNLRSIERKIGWNRYILAEYQETIGRDKRLGYRYLRWLSKLYTSMGDKKKAMSYLRQAIQADPGKVVANLKLIMQVARGFLITTVGQ
jgi:glycosyltransferase involved in cell wall biosynthesis